MEELPSLEECYAVAIRGSNLRVAEHGRTSADYIMAAGMLPPEHRFGAMMIRLVAEHAGVASEVRQSDEYAKMRAGQASKLSRIKSIEVGGNAVEFDGPGLAEALRRRSAGEIMAARVMILSRLPSLERTKQEFGKLACHRATVGWMRPNGRKVHFMGSDSVACSIAGRVLDAFLDPICHHCDGTKSKGSDYRGEKAESCRPCGGTGTRENGVWNDDAEREFASVLRSDISERMSSAGAAMGRLLRRQSTDCCAE